MGFSTSGAVAILFIGLLVAVGIVYPTVETAHERRADAIDERDERALDLRNSDVALEATYDDVANELRVNVTNTGATTLSATETTLLVDGVVRPDAATSVEDDATRERVHSGEELQFIVSDVTDYPNRVKVVTEHGLARILTEVTDGQ
ncbi:flagellin [Natronosalvus halobius]|uniref:flagellin n=1 Tax=Natronosalvus halobius TaxID=2953746 RepID=UPI00209FF2DC|nr:flagellin [Natronosalvus halobius]USZ70446.1 flagellin [Natronosalvus halobius]